ncbi:glycogen debranching protein [Bifidobacterium sp. UTCIF-37]|uniref:glycogen debranching protein GlgX n=1 Tax=unclassified Bifidobacterium TaxID=2608897 RepID=UPI00112A2BA3|nr:MULTISPECIES: glycogen debranching protein GlgX [unclassified Bifidobacterium]TPF87094.1 glycogen debranching protein [Bifidobacterium sp. UTCIF-37]TPF90506.1 glycogen debranching protein [Bifidobacterium sp. UTCIF-38]
MRNPSLHRFATRPGFYFTEDGGADVIVRSETADQVWLSVIESLDDPTAFYQDAIRLFDTPGVSFVDQIHEFPVCMRLIEDQYVRETLFRMEGPNYGLWYVHIPKAWSGMHYGFRVDGAWDPQHGVRFNPYKLLLDPYAKGIDGKMELSPAAFSYECEVKDNRVTGSAFGAMSTVDSLGHMPISVAIDDRDERKHDADPVHPHIPWSKTVIYELHVKGFTAQAPWLPEELRGTYAGLAHPTTLAYLQGLGVTSIELLPIQAKQNEVFLQERGRVNYWGYNTLGFFAPEPSYATKSAQEKGAEAVREEVLHMVRALHEAGFEVIMDVVYNHSCEGGVEGPTVCWRGLDAISYYRRQKNNIARLEDTTGCGNTFDFTNTHVVTFAIDSLRYWAKRIGIDGFRFDLGVSLARLNGEFTQHHPFLYALRSDLLLGNLKLIMEPWDLGNLGWRTGQFSLPFAEWNDRFRDTTRQFWLTDVAGGGRVGRIGMQEMATRLCGSADLFATDPGRGAASSINFVSCHDGFTLTDLTRYTNKHNEANGENNNDGSNVNNSTNFGVEGRTDDMTIIARRERAAMNMLGTLLLSLGTPMMLAGDEYGNSQAGNNNAYCQDGPISYLKWDWLYTAEKNWHMHRLETVSKLISLRKSLDLYHQEGFFTRLTQLGLLKPSSRIQWFLPDGTTPMERDWFDLGQRSFAMQLLDASETDVIIVINGVPEDRQFRLPADSSWTPAWCSAESTGHLPGHGLRVQDVRLSEHQSTWASNVPEDSNIHELVERMQSDPSTKQMQDLTDAFDADMKAVALAEAAQRAAEKANATLAGDESDDESGERSESAARGEAVDAGGNAGMTPVETTSASAAEASDETSVEADDTTVGDLGVHSASEESLEEVPEEIPDDNVWTFPALSITLMKQLLN